MNWLSIHASALHHCQACAVYQKRRPRYLEFSHATFFSVSYDPQHVPYAGPLAKLAPEKVSSKQQLFDGGYSWQESDSPSFFPGRHADIFVKGQRVGEFGIIHPTVLQKFDIPNPVTALELNIEPFCFDQLYQPLQTHSIP